MYMSPEGHCQLTSWFKVLCKLTQFFKTVKRSF